MNVFVNIVLFLAYALIIGAGVLALGLPLVKAVQQPKRLVRLGITVGGLLVLFLISYLISGSEVSEVQQLRGITGATTKLVGGALILMYILLVGAFVSILYSEIAKHLKR